MGKQTHCSLSTQPHDRPWTTGFDRPTIVMLTNSLNPSERKTSSGAMPTMFSSAAARISRHRFPIRSPKRLGSSTERQSPQRQNASPLSIRRHFATARRMSRTPWSRHVRLYQVTSLRASANTIQVNPCWELGSSKKASRCIRTPHATT